MNFLSYIHGEYFVNTWLTFKNYRVTIINYMMAFFYTMSKCMVNIFKIHFLLDPFVKYMVEIFYTQWAFLKAMNIIYNTIDILIF